MPLEAAKPLVVAVAVINTLKNNWKEILLTFLAMQSIFAEMMEKGKTRVKKVFNLYHQNSNDGRQVIDGSAREEANVFEPMVFITHQVTEDTAVTGRVVFDAWTAASDTKLDNYTGASGTPIMGQTRVAANLGVQSERKVLSNRWTYGASLGFSSEYDYRSLNGSFDISRSFAKDNFTLGASIQYFLDEVDLFKDLSTPQNTTISTGLERKIFATSITASQILTIRDIVQFGLTFAKASGELESTASSVNISGVRSVESLPSTRSRYAISSKWVHGLSENSSVNLSYRYYFDQWDLSSHTFRAAYLFDVEEDESYVEVFGRAHDQSSVRFYANNFDQGQGYMTSDSDLQEFTSFETGLFYESSLEERKIFGFNLEDINISHSIVGGHRSNGMRYGYYQLGLSYSL